MVLDNELDLAPGTISTFSCIIILCRLPIATNTQAKV